MSRVFIIVLVFSALILSNCGNRAGKGNTGDSHRTDTGTAVISFREYEHNFGSVAEGEKVGYTFTFTNTGTSDLVISSASTTCGCTVPKYNTKPIPSGKAGTLEVIFDTSGRNGMQTKTITVKSNASVPVVLLKIVAEVITDSNL